MYSHLSIDDHFSNIQCANLQKSLFLGAGEVIKMDFLGLRHDDDKQA